MTVLITGVQYQCKDEDALKRTLTHLEQDNPDVILIRKTTHDYGVVVDVKERLTAIGMVSRFDLLDVLELMRLRGFGVLNGKVIAVSMEGGWFVVEVEAPNDFAAINHSASVGWAEWQVPDIPLMADIPGRGEVESTIAFLDAALHCYGEYDVETTVESIRNIIDMSRYDVTLETQMALKEFRRLVDVSADSQVHSMIDTLVNAINDMGSSKRQKEFDDVYYQSIIDSDEATDMINAWYSSFAYTKTDDMTIEEIRRDKLREIEQSLQTLPDDLYRAIDDKGRLLHLLLYKGIPYITYRALLSALVMRDYLLDELETVIAFDDDDDDDEHVQESVNDGPLDTPEAWRLWRIAQSKGWVDDNRQPLMSQKKAGILAFIMSKALQLQPRWAPFEQLWSIPNLANKYSQSVLCGYYSTTINTFEDALK